MIIEDDDGNFEYYTDVFIIRELFSQASIGETITFNQIEYALDRPMDDGAYASIHQAKILLEKEDLMVFGNIRSVGYKRLTDTEIIEAFEVDRRRLRTRAQRAARRLTNVNNYSNLSPEHKITHQAGLGVLAAVARVTSPRILESVKETVSPILPKNPTQVPVGRIIEIMREKVNY
jgi:hypothetical protein